MKTKIIIFALLLSCNAYAANPHGFDVISSIATSDKVTNLVSKYSNYYFSNLVFEESDNGWSEHTFALTLLKFNGDGPSKICFWIDYDESINRVTYISNAGTNCEY